MKARRRGELAAAAALSVVAVVVWLGLLELRRAMADRVDPDVEPPSGPGEGALLNREIERRVAACVRQESSARCLAVTRDDPSLCGDDQECLDDTYLILGVKGKRSCGRILGPDQRKVCEAALAGDRRRCEGVSSARAAECRAVAGGELAACDEAAGAARQRCRGVWHFAMAVLRDDAALCNEIPRVYDDEDAPNLLRIFCIAAVKMDAERCHLPLRASCLRRVPLDGMSRFDCPLLKEATLRQRCRTQLAGQGGGGEGTGQAARPNKGGEDG